MGANWPLETEERAKAPALVHPAPPSLGTVETQSPPTPFPGGAWAYSMWTCHQEVISGTELGLPYVCPIPCPGWISLSP